MRLFFSIISCVLFLFLGCKDTSTINPDDTTVIDSTFTDIRDNRKYTIVKIGKQVWMSENLQTSTYRNGDSVRYARTNEEWVDAADNREEPGVIMTMMNRMARNMANFTIGMQSMILEVLHQRLIIYHQMKNGLY